MSEKPSSGYADAYWALARGPGSLRQAADEAARRPLTEDVTSDRPEEPAAARPTESAPPRPLEGLPTHVSVPCRRLLEELCAFVTPDTAAMVLGQGLREIGVDPEGADSFDLRLALTDSVPELLHDVLGDDTEAILERLEAALVDVNAPTPYRHSLVPT
jgi:hypothetical protein